MFEKVLLFRCLKKCLGEDSFGYDVFMSMTYGVWIRKRQRCKYEAPTLFQDKKLQEKFNARWVNKKVINV